MITVERSIHIGNGERGRRRVREEPPPAERVEPGCVPRISRLMALAIRFERLIAEGEITDQSELARLARVTQPRMTQILNLLHLAPDIQEALLFLPRVMEGRATITERNLRPIVAETTWARQRVSWNLLCSSMLRVPQEFARLKAQSHSSGHGCLRRDGQHQETPTFDGRT